MVTNLLPIMLTSHQTIVLVALLRAQLKRFKLEGVEDHHVVQEMSEIEQLLSIAAGVEKVE